MVGTKRRGKRPAAYTDEGPSAKRHPVALAPPVISRQSSSGSPSESVENEEFVPALPSPARGRGSGRGRGRTSKAVVAKVAQPVITHCFKNPAHKSSGKIGSKKPVWKSLKQIIAAERALPFRADDPIYSSIEAPPSLKPVKKYADLSGLLTNYTDPVTKLRYASAAEFQQIRSLPPDTVQGYLALRGAQTAT